MENNNIIILSFDSQMQTFKQKINRYDIRHQHDQKSV